MGRREDALGEPEKGKILPSIEESNLKLGWALQIKITQENK